MIESILIIIFMLAVSSIFGMYFIKILNIRGENIDTSIKYISPLIGLSIIISLMQNGSIFVQVKYIVIFIIVLSIYGISFLKQMVNDKDRILFIVILISAFVALMPSFIKGFGTSFSYINNDLLFYLSIPEWLKSNSYFSSPNYDVFHPLNAIANLHLSRFSRVGTDYISVFLMIIFGKEAYQTFNIVGALFIILNIIAIYYTCKYCFKVENTITYIVLILISVNTFIYWQEICQYTPMIGGNAFYILSIGLIYKLFREKDKKIIFILALSITGLISIYSEYIFFYVVTVVLYSIIDTIINKNILNKIRILCAIGISTILFNVVSSYLMIRYCLYAFVSTQNMNGIVEYIPFLNQIAMIFGIRNLQYTQMNIIFNVIAIVALILMIIGIIVCDKKIREILVCSIATIVISEVYFRYINKFPYGYYKIMMMSITFFVIAYSIGIYKVYKKYAFRKKVIIVGTLFIFLPCSINLLNLEKNFFNNGIIVDKQYIDLENIKKYVDEDKAIQINGVNNMAKQNLISYFLRDNKIFFDNPNNYYIDINDYYKDTEKLCLNNNYLLTENDIYKYDSIKLYNNETFSLYENNDFYINPVSGLYELEFWNGIPTRWINKEFKFNINNIKSRTIRLKFKANLPPNSISKKLTICIGNEIIDEIEINGNNEIYNSNYFNINEKQEITFKVDKTDKIGDDQRELGIALQELQVVKK